MLCKVKGPHLDQLKLWHQQESPCKWSRLCILMTGWLEWCSAGHVVQSLDCRRNCHFIKKFDCGHFRKMAEAMSFFLEPITRLFWPQFSLFSGFQLDYKAKGGFKSIWGPQISKTCFKNWKIWVFKSQDKFKFNKKILKNDRDISMSSFVSK